MSKDSIAHIFLEANPRSALIINTGHNEMFVRLESALMAGRNGCTFQFFGHGQTVADALQSLDADIAASGISVQTFAFPGHTQQALDAAREKAFAEMHRQIAEEEAAAMDEARENGRQEMFLRLIHKTSLTDEGARRHIAHLEHLAEVTV